MKKCPYCAEEIQDAAIKCKHCGEAVPADAPGVAVSDEWKAYCQRVHGLSEWQRRLELEKLDQDWERRDQYETACKALGYQAFDSPRAQQYAEILNRAPTGKRVRTVRVEPSPEIWDAGPAANSAGWTANRIGLGVIVVGGLIVALVAFFFGDPGDRIDRGAKPTISLEGERGELESKVATLLRTGMVRELNLDSATAYVDPTLWNAVDLRTKQGIAYTLAQHREAVQGTGRIEIVDAMNGKRLAKHSIAFGYKAY